MGAKPKRRVATGVGRAADAAVYRAAMDGAPCAMVVVDVRGEIVLVNREAERLFGYRRAELHGRPIELLVPDGVGEGHAQHRDRFLATPEARAMGNRRDLSARRSDGSVFPVEVGLNPVHTHDGVFVVSAVVDLTERQRAEQLLAQQSQLLSSQNAKLAELAVTDGLTGLRNRRAFIEQLMVQVELAVRHARSLSLLILDVDRFKPYNDEFGHLAGDEVLRQLAGILQEVARRSDFVARIGGEEFGIILPETDREGAVALGERFRTAVEGSAWPRSLMTASIGATTVDFARPVPRPEAPGISQLLSEADRALYHSKDAGRNRVTHVDQLAAEN